MTAKECLKQMVRLESTIKAKRKRAAALRQLAQSIGSSSQDGMPKNQDRSSSPMTNAICKAIDLENEIKKDEKKLQMQKMHLLDVIGRLENVDEQTVLIKRYFEHESWEKIVRSLCYSSSWVYQLHGQALEKLNELINFDFFSKESSKVE